MHSFNVLNAAGSDNASEAHYLPDGFDYCSLFSLYIQIIINNVITV